MQFLASGDKIDLGAVLFRGERNLATIDTPGRFSNGFSDRKDIDCLARDDIPNLYSPLLDRAGDEAAVRGPTRNQRSASIQRKCLEQMTRTGIPDFKSL